LIPRRTEFAQVRRVYDRIMICMRSIQHVVTTLFTAATKNFKNRYGRAGPGLPHAFNAYDTWLSSARHAGVVFWSPQLYGRPTAKLLPNSCLSGRALNALSSAPSNLSYTCVRRSTYISRILEPCEHSRFLRVNARIVSCPEIVGTPDPTPQIVRPGSYFILPLIVRLVGLDLPSCFLSASASHQIELVRCITASLLKVRTLILPHRNSIHTPQWYCTTFTQAQLLRRHSPHRRADVRERRPARARQEHGIVETRFFEGDMS
jgi:hypothetical protein